MKSVITLTITTFSLLYIALPAFSQSDSVRVITGSIQASRTGELLASATIYNAKTRQTALSSNNGAFSIKARLGDTLIFSHLQGKQRLLIVTQQTMGFQVITLEASEGYLSEVIVQTGFERLPLERVTGSFSQVPNSRFNEQVTTNVLSRLENVANSVLYNRQVGGGQLMIRGLSTIQGQRNPLIILDNFPYEGSLDNINPNDIEDITILKDAAAASIWGTRAGNGVVVINTKKGRYNQKVKTEVNASVTITEIPDLKYLSNISAADMVDLELDLFNKGYRLGDTASILRPMLTPVYELLLKYNQGDISRQQLDDQLARFRGHDVKDDFLKHQYERGILQQYAIGLSGGVSNMSWNIFAGIDRNTDQLDNRYNRLNLRLENRYRATKKLTISMGALYTHAQTENGRLGFGEVRTSRGELSPYTILADDAGQPLTIDNDYRGAWKDTVGSGLLLDWKYVPFEDHLHVSKTGKLNDLIGRFGMQYQILPGLSASLQYQYQRQTNKTEQIFFQDSYFTRNLINRFSAVDYSNRSVGYPVPLGAVADRGYEDIQASNFRGQVNVNTASGSFALNGIVGMEIRETKTNSEAYRLFGYDPQTLTTANVNLQTPYPTLPAGFDEYIPANTGLSERDLRFVSFFANAAVSYQDRYTLSLSARRDASNVFGLETNQKWNPVWSAGAAWNISKERFFHSKFIQEARLRMTYGYSGNVNPAASAVTTLSYTSTSLYTGGPIAVVDKFYNPELRWERVAMLNLGVDFSLLQRRITGYVEYYKKKSTDLFGTVPIDYTTGLRSQTVLRNVGEMEARGWDIEVNSVNLKGSVEWSTNLNLSFYRDRITKFYRPNRVGANFINGGTQVSGLEGRPVFNIYSYKWGGLDPSTGNPIGFFEGKESTDYNQITGTGTTVDDLVYNGPAIPTTYGSLGNTIRYKGVGLTVCLLYRFGHYFVRPGINYTSLISQNRGNAEYAQRWQEPGDEARTQVPSFVYPVISSRDAFYTQSEALVEKADYIRLQYINLSYRLTWPFRKGQSLEFYTVLNQVGVIWKATKTSYDPEYINSIPQPRSLTVGVRATF